MLELESIGARVELTRPGVAYFEATGLGGLYGDIYGVVAAARKALGRAVRVGVGPTRFCSLAAALESRTRRARVIDQKMARRYLASQPVSLLEYRERTALLVEPLQRLGIDTLGGLAGLGASAAADRFGEAGTIARALALGVVPGDVPNAVDGWAVAEGAVGALLVVVTDPVWQRCAAGVA